MSIARQSHGRQLHVTIASDIDPDPPPAMSHTEYVNFDGDRVFRKMVRRAKEQVARPEHYVLYSPRDLERLPPSPGVYIGFSEDGLCRYVGESVCVGRRVGKFLSRSELDGCKYIAFIPSDSEQQQYAMEFYWMGLLAPINNKQIRSKGKHRRFNFRNLFWDEVAFSWRLSPHATVTRDGVIKDGR